MSKSAVFRLLLVLACLAPSLSLRAEPTGASTPALSAAEVDTLISQRIEKSLQKLKARPEHSHKTAAELALLSRVGKATPEVFANFLQSLDGASEIEPEELLKEYQRIWYLADDAYKVLAVKKFNPKRALIPYLDQSVPQAVIPWLLPLFQKELKQESLDPRAMGAECSEMWKLQAIVERLQARLDEAGSGQAEAPSLGIESRAGQAEHP